MEGRRIKEYLQVDDSNLVPYTNHVGRGNQIGAGSRLGDGYGAGYKAIPEAYNSGIKSFNGNPVYVINDYSLYFTHIHEPWASAKIIKNDLTTQDFYVGKIHNHIVVASSIREALDELRDKIRQTHNNDYDIALAFFYAHPDYEKQYDWEEMLFWHSLSKFSCQQGRQRFSQNANKKAGSTASPKELIKLMKNSRAVGIAIIMEQLYLSKK